MEKLKSKLDQMLEIGYKEVQNLPPTAQSIVDRYERNKQLKAYSTKSFHDYTIDDRRTGI